MNLVSKTSGSNMSFQKGHPNYNKPRPKLTFAGEVAAALIGSPSLDTKQLDLALMDVEDIFDRAACPFFLLGETATSALEGKLTGSKLECGVLANELRPEVMSVLRAFVKSEITRDSELTNDSIKYTFNDVPIEIKVIHEKYHFFEHPEGIVYNYGDYLVANPMKDYETWKDLIK